MMSEDRIYANALYRLIAKGIDLILIAAVVNIVPRAGYYIGLIYLLLADGLFDGRSLGKKVLNLQVINRDTDGPCRFDSSVLRNSTLAVGYVLWLIIPWIGWLFLAAVLAFEFLLVLGSRDRTRLGDEIAKTVVLET